MAAAAGWAGCTDAGSKKYEVKKNERVLAEAGTRFLYLSVNAIWMVTSTGTGWPWRVPGANRH
jgi:hypothetical protein